MTNGLKREGYQSFKTAILFFKKIMHDSTGH